MISKNAPISLMLTANVIIMTAISLLYTEEKKNFSTIILFLIMRERCMTYSSNEKMYDLLCPFLGADVLEIVKKFLGKLIKKIDY